MSNLLLLVLFIILRYSHIFNAAHGSAGGLSSSTESTSSANALLSMMPLRKEGDVYARVREGRLKGFATTARDTGRVAYVFKKIPYAQPPVGRLRFARLRTSTPRWYGVRDATEFGPACMASTSVLSAKRIGKINEDCIHMNIYADERCFRRNGSVPLCPVIFGIAPGGFLVGSPTTHNDYEIVRKYATDGLVFVHPGYRLGIFGFIDADYAAPNNVGLNDLIVALEWTRREVVNFGGDRSRITLIGYSSGGSAAALLMASPTVSAEAFRSIIAVSPVPVLRPHNNHRHTDAVAAEVNCLVDSRTNRTLSNREMLECLRGVDGYALIEAQRRVEPIVGDVFFYMEPSAELPAHSFGELWRKHLKPRPILLLATRYEFAGFHDLMYGHECRNYMTIFGYFTAVAHGACVRRYRAKLEAANASAAEYHVGISAEGIHANAFAMALRNAHAGSRSYNGIFDMANHSRHADDLLFYTGHHRERFLNFTEEEAFMDRFYPEMIKNFVKHQDPGMGWKPVNPRTGEGYFVLDTDFSVNLSVPRLPYFHRNGVYDPAAVRFWLNAEAKIEWAVRRRNAKNISAVLATMRQSGGDIFGWDATTFLDDSALLALPSAWSTSVADDYATAIDDGGFTLIPAPSTTMLAFLLFVLTLAVTALVAVRNRKSHDDTRTPLVSTTRAVDARLKLEESRRLPYHTTEKTIGSGSPLVMYGIATVSHPRTRKGPI